MSDARARTRSQKMPQVVKAVQARARAQNPIERIRREYAARMVRGCCLKCFTCWKFIAQDGACPGMKTSKQNVTPLCHVDARTGRVECPV